MLASGGWLDAKLADSLKRMVAFRNIAVHDYQSLLLPILINVITEHMNEFLEFTQQTLLRDASA